MTKDEALKMAIEVNEWLKIKLWIDSCAADELDKVTNACKEALEQQEPSQCHWVYPLSRRTCERQKHLDKMLIKQKLIKEQEEKNHAM